MKKKISIALICALLTALFPACGANGTVRLLDANGETFAEYTGTLELYDAVFSAYAKTALLEAADAVAAQNGTSEEQALAYMLKKQYTVHTAADTKQILAFAEVGAGMLGVAVPYSAAATDLNGRLTAIYAAAGQTEKTYAGSAIKPLSVYAPCVESGVMHWSSMQEDSPVKVLESETGAVDWPANGSGTYSHAPVPAAEALAQSLNTVAVRWLREYGAAKALQFLREKFGMNVEREQSILAMTSEEEILGNVALGYLQEGVDVCEMAGYYQIFANGGRFIPAYTVKKITDPSDSVVYTAQPTEKQVVSAETAYILNRMLHGVVDHGTGTDAKIPGVDVVGKTGTSDNHADNWFVGVTPACTLAVWHGGSGGSAKNRAAALYAAFMRAANLCTDAMFPACEGVEQKIYCPESGFLAAGRCPGIAVGYYKTDELPDPCDKH